MTGLCSYGIVFHFLVAKLDVAATRRSELKFSAFARSFGLLTVPISAVRPPFFG